MLHEKTRKGEILLEIHQVTKLKKVSHEDNGAIPKLQ